MEEGCTVARLLYGAVSIDNNPRLVVILKQSDEIVIILCRVACTLILCIGHVRVTHDIYNIKLLFFVSLPRAVHSPTRFALF